MVHVFKNYFYIFCDFLYRETTNFCYREVINHTCISSTIISEGALNLPLFSNYRVPEVHNDTSNNNNTQEERLPFPFIKFHVTKCAAVSITSRAVAIDTNCWWC